MAKSRQPKPPLTRNEKADRAERDLLAHMREATDTRTVMDELMTAYRMGQEAARAGQPLLSEADQEAVRLKYYTDRIETALAELKAQAEVCMAEHERLKETMATCVKVAAKAELILGLGRIEEKGK